LQAVARDVGVVWPAGRAVRGRRRTRPDSRGAIEEATLTAVGTTGERPARVGVISEGPLVIVSLDRPPVNAVDRAMYAEIRDTFNGLRQAFPDGRVVVLEGRGRHFCAGNDLADFETMTAANAPGRMQGVREAFWAIRDCPLPVVAAVHGSALGTGLAIAASA